MRPTVADSHISLILVHGQLESWQFSFREWSDALGFPLEPKSGSRHISEEQIITVKSPSGIPGYQRFSVDKEAGR